MITSEHLHCTKTYVLGIFVFSSELGDAVAPSQFVVTGTGLSIFGVSILSIEIQIVAVIEYVLRY
ncbi:hypothetical protein F5Y12DRAFT_738834 [Xylaria sp. FL1777]|nr:hypothetical protein F5Y12DRAFT_738834 [Xylaria sp. FL1777]